MVYIVGIHVYMHDGIATCEMWISHSLPSQAYCLKVKEMDDEEYEASVSTINSTFRTNT